MKKRRKAKKASPKTISMPHGKSLTSLVPCTRSSKTKTTKSNSSLLIHILHWAMFRWKLVCGDRCHIFYKHLTTPVTEKFDQAITDYSAGLELKIELLPQSSRQIAEAHYKLSMVLDLSAGRLSDSITHAENALESVEARLAELRNAVSGQLKVEEEKLDSKGKGKGLRILGDDVISKMTKSQMEAEVKELQGLREDLALKVRSIFTQRSSQ